MTKYEQGFLSKCAEYGLDAGTAMSMMQKEGQSLLARIVERVKTGRAVSRLLRGAESGKGLSISELKAQSSLLERWLKSKGFDPSALSGAPQGALSRSLPPGFEPIHFAYTATRNPKNARFGQLVQTGGGGSGTRGDFVPFNPKSKLGKAILLLQERYGTRHSRAPYFNLFNTPWTPENLKPLLEGNPKFRGQPIDYEGIVDGFNKQNKKIVEWVKTRPSEQGYRKYFDR